MYEDGNKIDVSSTSLDKIFETIVELTEKYETNEVQLIGSSKFSKGIKKEIQEAEMNKYNKNELNIELIGSKKYLNGIVNKIKETEMSQYNEYKLNINIING